MLSRFVQAAVLSAALALPGHVLAAGSSAPFGYTPDPAMMKESPAQLQARVRRACIATQAQLQNKGSQRGCGCYAARVIRGFDATELASYRSTGVFSDSARAKAYAALDACGLKRP